MDNCIFCKIANGEIPAATLYEDEDFRVVRIVLRNFVCIQVCTGIFGFLP